MNKREQWLQLIEERQIDETDTGQILDLVFEVITGEEFHEEHEMADMFDFLVFHVVQNRDSTFMKAYTHGEEWWLKTWRKVN